MKYSMSILMLCISLILSGQSYSDRMENEFIVKFKMDNVRSTNLNNLYNTADLSVLNAKIGLSNFQEIKSRHLKGQAVLRYNTNEFSLEEIIAMYKNTGHFEYVEPNFIAKAGGRMNTVPNDARYSNQWGLKNDGTFSDLPALSGADIDMELAWDIEKGDPDMIVAIIDSGVRFTHPEFAGRVWNNPNEVADGSDTDGNGYSDDLVAGWDFINNDNNPNDDHGHGTNVAGIALATGDNSIGYAGINWHSKIMVCKSLDETGNGSYSAMASAIFYAVDNGAKVINMSIGGSSPSFLLSSAIDYCYDNGVVLVACMMNFNNSVPYYPAAYPKTIAVGSTNPDDTRSVPFFWSATSGSNFGSHLDLVAPGNFMYGLSNTSDFWYGSYWGGTSQATPLVAGVISLLLAQNPYLTFEELRSILTESAEDQVGNSSEDVLGFDIYYGHGRLNAYNALNHQIVDVKDVNRLENDVVLYPNPIKEGNDLTISNVTAGEYSVTLYNISGQKSIQLDNILSINSTLLLPISDMSKGAYILKIMNIKENFSINKKLLIK